MVMGGVAIAQVGAGGLGQLVVAGIVRPANDEFHVRPEVALDSVEIAGVGRHRDQLAAVALAQPRMAGVQWADRLSITTKTPIASG
jgi:hypothetical protein